MESMPETDEIDNLIQEVVCVCEYFEMQINLEMENEEIQKLLDSPTIRSSQLINSLKCMSKSKTLKNLSLDPVRSDDRMTNGNLTEGLNLIENCGYNIFENTNSKEECIFATKQGIKKALACYQEILKKEKKKIFQSVDYLLQFMKSSTSKLLWFAT
ncbi:tigger transposable element-derived protein 1 [Trichonephila clavipes]|nr:tigger transposable element-derived protein 1 [Trichonephila clavipes]